MAHATTVLELIAILQSFPFIGPTSLFVLPTTSRDMVYVNVTLKVLPVNASHPRITVPRLLTITFTIAASGRTILWLFVVVHYVIENTRTVMPRIAQGWRHGMIRPVWNGGLCNATAAR